MPNFFTDNPDIQAHLEHTDLSEIIRLREHDFAEAEEYPEAPTSVEDAVEGYRRVLELVGEVSAEFIAERAEAVDREGARLVDGVVHYPQGIKESLDMLAKADLMGFTLPRRYGGLNLPVILYTMAIEIVSRADASLMTIFGLQDIAETINSYADEELKSRYLPRFASGEITGAMVLTEPDAGSDLQAIRLRAVPEEGSNIWRLTGVKRFITNGCGDVLLVLARSEPDTTDGTGLSLFLCERCPEIRVRRIEDKLGIHGSPTCELQFDNAPGYLVGRRRRGLMEYTMDLMNGARIAIASQSIGIAESAYREALEFASRREQFGRAIVEFPAVLELLTEMKVSIESARALTYETARVVDTFKSLKSAGSDDRARIRYLSRLADALTPMTKYYASEMCVRVTSDAIQIHGGSGFMRDYPAERHFRDGRITNIYEGTSQLQVVAAISAILGGKLFSRLEELSYFEYPESVRDLTDALSEALQSLFDSIEYVRSLKDREYVDYHARRIVENACDIYIGYLLLSSAVWSAHKEAVARYFVSTRLPLIEARARFVLSGERILLENRRRLLFD